jgi:hypothetical protein
MTYYLNVWYCEATDETFYGGKHKTREGAHKAMEMYIPPSYLVKVTLK